MSYENKKSFRKNKELDLLTNFMDQERFRNYEDFVNNEWNHYIHQKLTEWS